MNNNIANPDDLFDDLVVPTVGEAEKEPDLTAQLEGNIEVLSETRTEDHNVVEVIDTTTVEKTESKSKKHRKAKVEGPDPELVAKDKTIAKLTKDLDAAKVLIEELKEGNTLTIDVGETDERKKLIQLMIEGKIMMDKKDKPFILAEQVQAPHNPAKPPIHKIYLEDIEYFNIRTYYKDMTLLEAGDREFAYKRIWCHHKGYCGCDIITAEQYQYCLDQGYAPKVTYSHVDLATGQSIYMNTNDAEPSLKQVTDEIERQDKIAENMKSKKKFVEEESEEVVVDDSKEVEEIASQTAEPLPNLETTNESNS